MFKVGKKYKTRGGREVRVLSIDGRNKEIRGFLKFEKREYFIIWNEDGSYLDCGEESIFDLMPKKKRAKKKKPRKFLVIWNKYTYFVCFYTEEQIKSGEYDIQIATFKEDPNYETIYMKEIIKKVNEK